MDLQRLRKVDVGFFVFFVDGATGKAAELPSAYRDKMVREKEDLINTMRHQLAQDTELLHEEREEDQNSDPLLEGDALGEWGSSALRVRFWESLERNIRWILQYPILPHEYV